MRKHTKGLLATLVLTAAGFAAAGIMNGGSFAAALESTTGISDTVPTATVPTTTASSGQKVTICHRTHSKKNPGVTITVSQDAVAAHMNHGDTLGACADAKAKGKGKPEESKPATKAKSDDDAEPDDDNGKPNDAGKPDVKSKSNGNGHGNAGGHGKGKGK